jgi:hypothetical protein
MRPDPAESSATGTADFRLAVFSHIDPHEMATLLHDVIGILPLDGVLAAKETPGLIGRPMTRGQADELVRRLHEDGISAYAISANSLPSLANATLLHHVQLSDAGLTVLDLYGEVEEMIPWSAIGVIAIGQFPAESSLHAIDETRPSVLSAAPLPTAWTTDAGHRNALELWLLARMSDRLYCIRHDRFNYDSLGDEMTDSATVNFDHFVRRVIPFALHATQTPSTHAYLAKSLVGYSFPDQAALERQSVLHWIMRRAAENPES